MMLYFASLPVIWARGQWNYSLPNAANISFNFYYFLVVTMLLYIPCEPCLDNQCGNNNNSDDNRCTDWLFYPHGVKYCFFYIILLYDCTYVTVRVLCVFWNVLQAHKNPVAVCHSLLLQCSLSCMVTWSNRGRRSLVERWQWIPQRKQTDDLTGQREQSSACSICYINLWSDDRLYKLSTIKIYTQPLYNISYGPPKLFKAVP